MTFKHWLRYLVVLFGSWLVLGIFLYNTDPRTLPAVLLIIPFLLFFGSLFITLLGVFKILRPQQAFFTKKHLIAAAVLAFLPTLCLVLKSIGQLTVRDTALLVIFVIIVLLYVVRADFSRSN